MGKEKTDLDLDWERRTLCSDGSCIGVIGPDGKCKECGKPYEGDLPEAGAFEDAASSETEDTAASEEEAEAVASADTEKENSEDLDDEWESRRLCSDGNCIGVIGRDGKCKECGKPFEG